MLVADDATSVEFRDEQGKLIRLLIFLPGRDSFLDGVAGDRDFDDYRSNMGFKKIDNPPVTHPLLMDSPQEKPHPGRF